MCTCWITHIVPVCSAWYAYTGYTMHIYTHTYICYICILGIHKMKGIVRVILPEEPNLEEIISQLGRIFPWHAYTTPQKQVVHALAYRLHDNYNHETNI